MGARAGIKGPWRRRGRAPRGTIAAAVLALAGLVTSGGLAGVPGPAAAAASAPRHGGHYGFLHAVPASRRHLSPASRAGSAVVRPFLTPDPQAYARQKAAANARRPRHEPAGAVAVTAAAPRALGPRSAAPRLRGTPQVVTTFPAPTAQEMFPGGSDPTFVPADTSVAVSDSFVVEEMNKSAFIFTKGGHLLQSFDLRTFYGVTAASETVTDPRIVFDSNSDRWYSTVLQCTIAKSGKCDGTPDAVLLAVSLSADPSPSNWKVYVVDNETSGVIDDQPRIGFSSDKVVVAFDQYSSPGSFSNDEMFVIQKSDLVAAVPLPQMTSFNMNSGTNHRFGIVPAVPTPSDQTGFNAFAAYHGSDTLGQYASTLTITGTPAAADVGFTEAGPGISGMGTPPSASQPGAPNSIQTDDNRFRTVTETNGSLWIGANDSCTPTGDTSSRACARIIQVKLSPSPSVVSDVDLSHKGEDLYYPAVLASACSDVLYLTYTVSSATEFPTAEVATSPIPLASVFTTRDYGAGTTKYLGQSGEKSPFRWGDYSGISSDGSDFCSHGPWVAAEIGGTTAGQPNWTTAIGQFTQDRPIVNNVTPKEGAPGTQVTISGTSFTPDSVVLFGSTSAQSVSFLDGDDLLATAPPHTPATVNVTVVTPLGTSTALIAPDDLFTYPVLAFTANSGAADVTGFDTSTMAPVSTIPLIGTTPHEIAIAPDATRAYVTDAAGQVVPVNLVNHLEEPPIPTGAGASGIALTPDGHYAVVANTAANSVTRIDLTTIPPTASAPLSVPGGPTQVAITPNGQTAYVTDVTGNAVSVVNINPFALGAPISGVAGPWGDTVSPDGSTLWVTSPETASRGGVVYEISTASNTIVNTLFLGQNDPHGVTETPDQSKVFVADESNSAVTEILTGSPPTVGPTILVGPGALELAATPDSSTVYVTDNGANNDTPVATAGPAPGPAIPADVAPYGIALTQPLVRTCPTLGLSALTLGFTPPSAPKRSLVVEVGDVFSCDQTSPIKIVTTTAVPSGCPAVKVPTRKFTPVLGDNPLIRGFTAPGCAGTYTETMTLKSGTTTITTAKASFQVEKSRLGG
jgi:DNA-binding beta-propeller fold protein YncE